MSALILAIDTTGDPGSIALISETGLVAEADLGPPGAFADVLFGAIEALLAKAGVSVTEISAFAAASGPGSFTGVRIGLTAVKGLAEAAGRPAIAVSNLQALAYFGTGHGKDSLRAVFLDARRGEIYGAVYNAALEPVREEVAMKLDAWLASLAELARRPEGEVEIITNHHALAEVMSSALLASGLPIGWPVLAAPHALAIAIGRIALERLQRGLAQDPIEIDANYVRRSDAELLWKDPVAAKRPAAR